MEEIERSGRYSEADARNVIENILNALEYLHCRNIFLKKLDVSLTLIILIF